MSWSEHSVLSWSMLEAAKGASRRSSKLQKTKRAIGDGGGDGNGVVGCFGVSV